MTTTHKFWVDATDFGCKGNYTWCGADQANVTIEGVENYWADGKAPEPSERTSCLALALDKEKPGLTAQPCNTEKDIGFICESGGSAIYLFQYL